MLTIIGPTACGKTRFAVRLAQEFDGEIISGDSRQVYRRMDLGTGKDLSDYESDGKKVAYHLIDIAEPGTKYNVYQFQRDFVKAYQDVSSRGKLPILCGGTGLYIESVLRGYRMSYVPENKALRKSLEGKSLKELTEQLRSYKELHNTTDVDTAQRAIRAIEIEEYNLEHPVDDRFFPQLQSLVIGVDIKREERRRRITHRLRQRLDEGMVDEVRQLLDSGIPAENLIYYGLEYKYVTEYVIGKITFDEMFTQLEIAIHQFAKRQMTWFRGMERRGTVIHWIDYDLPLQEKVETVKRLAANHAPSDITSPSPSKDQDHG